MEWDVVRWGVSGLALITALVIIVKGIVMVEQTENALVERWGRYERTLSPGLSMIIPVMERVAHRVNMMERRSEVIAVSVVTMDNVEVVVQLVVFFRVKVAESAQYRVEELDGAIRSLTTSLMRNSGGQVEFDELQRSRKELTAKVKGEIGEAARQWGVEITQVEVEDVIVDESTKLSMRLQLSAERERRAEVTRAEGAKKAVELNADAELYAAEKQAEAIRVTAKAEAFAVVQAAEAQADQLVKVGKAMAGEGSAAAEFEVTLKRVAATESLAAKAGTHTLFLPGEALGVLGAAGSMVETWQQITGGAGKEAAKTGGSA